MTSPLLKSIELFDASKVLLHPPVRNSHIPDSPFWIQYIEVFNAAGQRVRIQVFLDDENNAQLEAEYQKTLQPLPLFEELTEVQP